MGTVLNQPPPWAPPSRKWHEKTGWIILLLVLLAPVGIFLLYRAGLWRAGVRHVVSAIAGVWFLFALIGVAAGDPDKEDDVPAEVANFAPSATASAPAVPPAAPEPAAPTTPDAPPTPIAAPAAPVDPTPPAPAPTSAEPVAPPTTARPVPPPTVRPTTPAPAPTRTTAPVTRQPTPTPAQVSYKNCDAVRAAGAAPIHRGEPGYAPHLDRDNDGIGCE